MGLSLESKSPDRDLIRSPSFFHLRLFVGRQQDGDTFPLKSVAGGARYPSACGTHPFSYPSQLNALEQPQGLLPGDIIGL